MSFHVDDRELQAHAQRGAKISAPPPAAPTAPKPAPEPVKPTEMQEMATAMKTMAAAVTEALNRDQEPPEINVAAPKVTIMPATEKAAPRKWKVTVTKRDNTYERRIEELKIEAVD